MTDQHSLPTRSHPSSQPSRRAQDLATRLETTTAELSKASLLPAGDRIVAGIVARLVTIYGQSMNEHAIKAVTEIWVEELADYPADLLTVAYHHIVRNHTGGWFPKPAEMIGHMGADMRSRRDCLPRPQRTQMLASPPPTDEERRIAMDALARIRGNLRMSA